MPLEFRETPSLSIMGLGIAGTHPQCCAERVHRLPKAITFGQRNAEVSKTDVVCGVKVDGTLVVTSRLLPSAQATKGADIDLDFSVTVHGRLKRPSRSPSAAGAPVRAVTTNGRDLTATETTFP
jgi:hypothetical protein